MDGRSTAIPRGAKSTVDSTTDAGLSVILRRARSATLSLANNLVLRVVPSCKTICGDCRRFAPNIRETVLAVFHALPVEASAFPEFVSDCVSSSVKFL